MEKEKIIILLLAIVIIILVGSMIIMQNSAKLDAKLKFKSESEITQASTLKIKLTDIDGNELAKQNIDVVITGKDNSSSYSLVSDKNGIAKLKINEKPGKYTVTLKYKGDSSHNPCNASKKITVKTKTVKTQKTNEPSQSSDPGAFYSQQAGRWIYTGEVQFAPDEHHWKHLGNNKWVKID